MPDILQHHFPTKPSRILETHAVKAIDQSSSSQIAGCVLGIGMILANFQSAGTTPDVKDELKILQTGSASS